MAWYSELMAGNPSFVFSVVDDLLIYTIIDKICLKVLLNLF